MSRRQVAAHLEKGVLNGEGVFSTTGLVFLTWDRTCFTLHVKIRMTPFIQADCFYLYKLKAVKITGPVIKVGKVNNAFLNMHWTLTYDPESVLRQQLSYCKQPEREAAIGAPS